MGDAEDLRPTLFSAISCKKPNETVIQLINLNKNLINVAYGCDKITALIEAIRNDYTDDIITQLINNGADVNQPDCKGRSPLMYAMRCKNTSKIGPIIINAGADLFKCDDYGRNVLMYSDCENCDGNYCKNKEMIDLLLIKGCDVKQIDKSGNSVIHMTRCNYLIGLAINKGVSIDLFNSSERTALTKAVSDRDIFKVKYLLSFGAQVKDTYYEKNSFRDPLEIILYNKGINNGKILTLLLYYGAELLGTGSRNMNVLCYLSEVKRTSYSQISSTLKSVVSYLVLYFGDRKGEFFKELYSCMGWYAYGLVSKCKQEVTSMRNTFLTNDLTFYDFCIRKQYYYNECINISTCDYKYNFGIIKNMFPIYGDLIILRITTNHSQNFRKVLRKSCESIVVEAVNLDEKLENVHLNYDCIDLITGYLNFKEMYNLFLAAVDE